MSHLDQFAMLKHCGDCAFLEGTEAHGEEMTRITAELCVMSGEPFYCHRKDDAGKLVARPDGEGGAVLCRGFVDAFVAQGPPKDWQAAVSSECLRIMEEAIDGRIATAEEINKRVLAAGAQEGRHE